MTHFVFLISLDFYILCDFVLPFSGFCVNSDLTCCTGDFRDILKDLGLRFRWLITSRFFVVGWHIFNCYFVDGFVIHVNVELGVGLRS